LVYQLSVLDDHAGVAQLSEDKIINMVRDVCLGAIDWIRIKDQLIHFVLDVIVSYLDWIVYL